MTPSRILTTQESLMNYAAWYAMRYLPSIEKLRESLMKKSAKNNLLVDSVMEEMTTYISEKRTIDGLVQMYTEQGKTQLYIEQKLKTKKFWAEVIRDVLDVYKEIFWSYETYEHIIVRKIHDYINKNKSKKYIYYTLIKVYPNFSSEITSLVQAIIPDENNAIELEYQKLSKKYDLTLPKERQKVIQKLCLKGFSYDIIKKILKVEGN